MQSDVVLSEQQVQAFDAEVSIAHPKVRHKYQTIRSTEYIRSRGIRAYEVVERLGALGSRGRRPCYVLRRLEAYRLGGGSYL